MHGQSRHPSTLVQNVFNIISQLHLGHNLSWRGEFLLRHADLGFTFTHTQRPGESWGMVFTGTTVDSTALPVMTQAQVSLRSHAKSLT